MQLCDYFKDMEIDSKKKKTLVKRTGPPKEEDWRSHRPLYTFLRSFFHATLKRKATKTITSDIVMGQLIPLQIEIERKKNDSTNPTMQGVASTMLRKINKYWGKFEKVNPLMFLA